MAKKLESSKATAKQNQTAHIQYARCCPNQCLMAQSYKAYHPRRKKAVRNQTPVKALNHSKPCGRNSQTNTNLMTEIQIQCTRCGNSPHAQGFHCPAKKFPMQTMHKNWTLHKDLLYQNCTSTAGAIS